MSALRPPADTPAGKCGYGAPPGSSAERHRANGGTRAADTTDRRDLRPQDRFCQQIIDTYLPRRTEVASPPSPHGKPPKMHTAKLPPASCDWRTTLHNAAAAAPNDSPRRRRFSAPMGKELETRSLLPPTTWRTCIRRFGKWKMTVPDLE